MKYYGKFLNKNGHEHEPKYAIRCGFVEGQMYAIESAKVGGFHSSIKFRGVDGYHNSVMFEIYDENLEKAEEKFYHDPLFSEYF